MVTSARTRWLILGGVLLATVVASVWPNGRERSLPEIVAPVTQRDSTASREQTLAAQPELPPITALRERQHTPPQVHDLFDARTWNPPPSPKQAKPAPPAAPMAPPVPYMVAGSIADANGVMVVFTNQNQNFVVRVGELLDQTYRVESIDAESVTLTYLPLGLMQRVPMPGGK